MDVGASALLEWVNILEAENGRQVQSLEELEDGRVLLEIMNEALPDSFPDPGPSSVAQLRPLVLGLREHFRGRQGRGENYASQLADQEDSGTELDISLLVQLVIWATFDNDLPGSRRQLYMNICEQLSDFSKQAIMDIAQHFGTNEAPVHPAFTPLVRGFTGESLAMTPVARHAAPAMADELPDFMEVGLDDETRYRRLKKRYHAVMEEQERIEDERNLLRRQLEAEAQKRQDAEEAERMARAELRESDEAKLRMKEENRALFDMRLEQESQNFREQLKVREKQLEALRDEIDVARLQAGKAERLSEQMALCKKKLEEAQVWKREKEELKRQLDEAFHSQAKAQNTGSGAADHLRSMLDRTRSEANVLLEERDEAQRQVLQLQQELGQVREEQLASREELRHFRRGDKDGDRGSVAPPVARDGADRSPKEGSSGVEELKDLLHNQKDDLLERLLVEKERATRAETTLQLKQAEISVLTERSARETEALAKLEERCKGQAARLAELEEREKSAQGAPQPPQPSGDDGPRVRELQTLLVQRERELQIHRWRGQTESNALIAQESLMVSCFHEMGLRYSKLRAQKEALQRRLKEQGVSGEDGGASPPADGEPEDTEAPQPSSAG